MRLDEGGWVVSLNDIEKPKARLICFSFEGGKPDYFHSWVPHLREGIELLAIQLPGRGSREEENPFTSVSVVIDNLLANLASYFDKPFIFFGHSLGAILAYELTNQLAHLGRTMPKRLIVSGCQAPSDQGNYFRKISQLDDQDFFEDLMNEDCISPWLISAPEEVGQALTYIRADYEMRESYRPDVLQVFNIPVDVFAGSRDVIPLGNLLEWQKVSRFPVHVCVFKGDHFFIEEDKKSVLNHVNELFDEVIVTGAYA